jgi:hypothetical protein
MTAPGCARFIGRLLGVNVNGHLRRKKKSIRV